MSLWWWFCNLQWLRPAGLYERCKLALELKRLKTPVLELPSAGSSFLLASDPANFFSSSLSVPTLFFLLPLFLAQLHFLFCLSILHARSLLLHTHISNASSCFCSFWHSVQVSAPYNTTLHTKHFTSLFRSSFSKGPQKMLLLPLLSSALLLDSSSCCLWYYTPSIWNCPLVQCIHF